MTSAAPPKLLYTSQPFFFTQPATLAAMAALHGVEAAPAETARVLELGCASGGNLIPMAARFPGANFVGVDLEQDAIAEGQKRIAALKLSNIKLEAADILDIAERAEQFDYLICHGVLSWVPKKVRSAIFRICKTQLSPRGIAMLSFNVLPGWRLEQIVRDICVSAYDPELDPHASVRRAIAALEAVAAGTPENTPYGFLVRQAALRLANANPSYMLAEYLAPVNKCFRFEAVARRAEKAGVHYVSEPELATSLPEKVLPNGAAQARMSAAGDPLKLQGLLDEMSGRCFRRAIFSKQPARAEPETSALSSLHAAVSLRRDPSAPRNFHTGSGHTYTAPNDEVADALAELSNAYPASRAIANFKTADKNALESALLLLATSGHLRLQSASIEVGRASCEKPVAFAVARLEASEPKGWFTTLQHHSVAPSADSALILPHLDGSRDRAALSALLSGDNRAARVEAALQQLEQAALLNPAQPS